ncbi:MAG: ribosomal protein [Patescibacteria group bacterium]|nr:ribosomal protein [Patescibacteria group bacterium]
MIKKGDSVIVIAGGDKGKKGTVTKSFPKLAQVIVEGVNIKKIHKKPKTTDAKGSIVEVAKPINVSNVKLAK